MHFHRFYKVFERLLVHKVPVYDAFYEDSLERHGHRSCTPATLKKDWNKHFRHIYELLHFAYGNGAIWQYRNSDIWQYRNGAIWRRWHELKKVHCVKLIFQFCSTGKSSLLYPFFFTLVWLCAFLPPHHLPPRIHQLWISSFIQYLRNYGIRWILSL